MPASGELGYFVWHPTDNFAPVKLWMQAYDGGSEPALFSDLAPSFKKRPKGPGRST